MLERVLHEKSQKWMPEVLAILVGFIVACAPATAPSAAPPAAAPQATAPPAAVKDTVLNFYSGGDTNVQDLHQKDMIPGFEQSSGAKVTFTFSEHGTGFQGFYDRLMAQKQTNKDNWDIDLMEADTGYFTRPDGIFSKITAQDVPNLSKVPPPVLQFVQGLAVPYRASSVVLAYNSAQVPNPPSTYDELLTWIKGNPGKFAYNEPTTGGSGDAFVIAMLYKHSDYNKYVSQPFNADNEKDWDAAFQELRDLAPSLYQKGVYPKGNAGTLDLLNRGEIAMGTVWSDQATQALAAGQLPKAIKLSQISPALTGGDTYMGVPDKAAHKQAAFAYINYLLEPAQQQKIVTGTMAGFPGVDWQYLPADARSRFAGADKEFRLWPGGTYGQDMGKLWHDKVAAQS